MRTYLAVFRILLLFGLGLLPRWVTAEDTSGDQQSGSVEKRGRAVDTGYVVLEGRYLPPPYVPERRNDDLLINGQMAMPGYFALRRGWPGGGRRAPGPGVEGERGGPMDGDPMGGGPPSGDAVGDGPVGGGPIGGGPMGGGPPRGFPIGPRGGGPMGFGPWGPQASLSLVRVERSLKDGALLLGGEQLHGGFLYGADAICVLDILLSTDSPEVKHERILNEHVANFDEDQWRDVIASFQPSAELAARIEPLAKEFRDIEKANRAKHESIIASAFLMSRPVKYTITLVAMGLVVAACGTLLNYRPQGRVRWSEVDREGEGIPIVVRSVVLLVVLGLFDLGCTLVAEQAGGFTELNPLATNLVANPVSLAGFKLATLLSACAILYALRRYRGAQVAAWWMCLLCTVLTFRWLTYNSMFMT